MLTDNTKVGLRSPDLFKSTFLYLLHRQGYGIRLLPDEPSTYVLKDTFFAFTFGEDFGVRPDFLIYNYEGTYFLVKDKARDFLHSGVVARDIELHQLLQAIRQKQLNL